MGYINIDVKRRFMGRFKYDNDLLQEITNFIINENIRSGEIRIIGAVKKARFGYFNQSTKEYKFIEKNEHMEILSAIGNISLKNGKPFPHVHITLADKDGNVFGGHLMEGTKIFAAEFVIVDYGESNLERVDDEFTGLQLWNL
ncbi:PPC domain-containing DNA-binding protein [Thermoanaerobacterium thermosaccharolyticum]|uniref:PPC domain-containing DNA-binding protein n=1 Tax=Thermoanaerobacterium thermosaccharolyticum TaxID=1517 RepID=UPI00177F5F56|nr:PPC domain-containing DNA-binding protein [Thermoanaerobacterium thermosaccharolyticum]MBE0068780.1 DNA-binding protein [Thermoanaerobacterium thermosaccharolyticum]MBE0229588.1 DNA-binding protein [Thermoanaerobacterium thermosaccharolyticum]